DADGDDERPEDVGVEAGQLGGAAERARKADEEDRRRQDARDRGARDTNDLVERAARERADDPDRLDHASRSLPRSATTDSQIPSAAMPSAASRPSSAVDAVTGEMIGSRMASAT